MNSVNALCLKTASVPLEDTKYFMVCSCFFSHHTVGFQHLVHLAEVFLDSNDWLMQEKNSQIILVVILWP